jgi:hypothetical protein
VVLAAQVPDAPATPTTAVQDSSVLVDWSAPNEQGSPIIGYQIWIRKSDGTTFAIDSTSCDGAEAAIVASTSCLIPIATLRAGSFQLPWGSSVYAKVIAYNLYGYSASSVVGNGAVILTSPDAPINLKEIVASRSATSISI